jgi:hypothetical protein
MNSRRAIRREPPFNALPVLAHPRLLVNPDELAELRANLGRSPWRELFAALRDHADAILDPAHPDYPDWETLRDPRWRHRRGLALAVHPMGQFAFLYLLTGDLRYLVAARGIAFAVIRNRLADAASSYTWEGMKVTAHYPGWRHGAGHDFGGHSLELAVFYDCCHDQLTAAERAEFIAYANETIKECSAIQAEVGRMGLNNRGSRCAIGNAMLALAIHGEGDPALVESALRIGLYTATAYANYSFDADGGSFEGVSYCGNASSWLALFGRALDHHGCRDLGLHPHYGKLPDFVLYNLHPTGRSIIPINDCARDIDPNPVFVAAHRHRHGVGRWLYDELRTKLNGDAYPRTLADYRLLLFADPTLVPVHPRDAGYPLSKHFRGVGYACLRSSWETDAAHAILYAGPEVYGGHRQDDQLTFTYCALGESFAWDPGYDSFAGVYAHRHYRDTEYHSTLLIDGLGQCRYDDRYWSRGTITEFADAPAATRVTADGRMAYGVDGHIRRFLRHLHFDRGPWPFLALADDVQADDFEHDYTWNFVAHPAVTLVPVAEGHWLLQAPTAACDLYLWADGPCTTRQDLAGTMPRLQATRRGVAARFAALLLPRWHGRPTPRPRVTFGPAGVTLWPGLAPRQTLRFP